MERDCESELSKLNIEQNACMYHFGASVIHEQRSNILRLLYNDKSIISHRIILKRYSLFGVYCVYAIDDFHYASKEKSTLPVKADRVGFFNLF